MGYTMVIMDIKSCDIGSFSCRYVPYLPQIAYYGPTTLVFMLILSVNSANDIFSSRKCNGSTAL